MPELNMLIGLPGSGKSYYANALKASGYVVHSSDAIREELFGDESIQGKPDQVFSLLHKRVINDLKAGKNVVYDATNINSKLRMQTLRRLNNIEGLVKSCTIIARPFEECVKMDRERGRTVGEDVLKKMISRWNTPSYGEGWDNIYIYYPNELDMNYYGSFKGAYVPYLDYDQNNSHHKLSLGTHIKSTATYVSQHSPILQDVVEAAYLHDIGKPYTHSIDEKGVSHYFQHANVGAYNTLFYGDVENPINVSLLVNYHMAPFDWNEKNFEKMEKKYVELLGEELYQGLLQLHDADILCSEVEIKEEDLMLV